MSSQGLKHRAGADPRAASLLALTAVMGGTDSQAALDKVLAGSELVPSDKALATELFYGTLRHHLRLEWFLKQKLAKPEGLPPEMLLLLEQTMFELAHTRIPAHAGVNWAVGLVRGRFGQGLSRVANGVLRGFERSKQGEYLNKSWYAEALGVAKDSVELKALWHGLPLWLAKLWEQNYSPDTVQAMLEAALATPPQALRLNTRREGINEVLDLLNEQRAEKLAPSAWILADKTRLPVSVWSKNGLVTRQSPAAYAALFSIMPHDTPEAWLAPVWDACAGRGGKTLALLERGIAVHTASDPSKGRIRGLADDYARLGLAELDNALPCPELLNMTAQETGFSQKFKTVLVDAPCSGLGTLSHRPEIRWRRTPDDIKRLSATQAEILAAAHRAIIPSQGSAIIYMTCTMTKDENETQTALFIAQHPEYALELEYRTPPQSGYGEFFYAALLRHQ